MNECPDCGRLVRRPPCRCDRPRLWAEAIMRAARKARAEGREPTAQDLARAAEEVP